MVSRMLPTHDEVCLLVKQRLIPGGKAKELRWRSYKTSKTRSILPRCTSPTTLRADHQIVVIPRLKQRIEVMLLCRRFDIQLAEILPDLGILKSAAVEIKSSTRLRDVLAVSPPPGTRLKFRRF
jgi:hypothetical protein